MDEGFYTGVGGTWSSLNDLVSQGKIQAVRQWIASYTSHDVPKERLTTVTDCVKPLFTAYYNSYHEIFDILLNSEIINSNQKNIRGRSIIHEVSAAGDVAILKKLIKHGADVNQRDIDGRTPLHKAARENRVDAITILVDHGSDLNARTEGTGEPVLHYSIERSSYSTIRCLVSLGCSLNELSRTGDTPLHVAVKEERLDVVVLLCDSGVNTDILNSRGFAAIHLAANLHLWDILSYFIKINASINLSTSDSETLLLMTTRFDCAWSCKVIGQLFRAGYDITNDPWVWNEHAVLFAGYDGQAMRKYILKLVLRVCTLRELACFTLRKCIGICLQKKIDKLRIPEVLKHVITMQNNMMSVRISSCAENE